MGARRVGGAGPDGAVVIIPATITDRATGRVWTLDLELTGDDDSPHEVAQRRLEFDGYRVIDVQTCGPAVTATVER